MSNKVFLHFNAVPDFICSFLSLQQKDIHCHKSIWTHSERKKKKNQISPPVIYQIDRVIIWCQSSVRNDILFAGLQVVG